MTMPDVIEDSSMDDCPTLRPVPGPIRIKRVSAGCVAALTGLMLMFGMTPAANADPADAGTTSTPVVADPVPDPNPTPPPTTPTPPPPAPVDKTKATLVFNYRGGVVTVTKKVVKIGAKVGSLPVAKRSGYTFKGWYTAASGGKKVTSSTKVPKWTTHTLYAHWTAKKYTVKFAAKGGNVSTKSKAVKFGSKYGKLPKPTRSGYKFTGWYTKAGVKVTSGTKVTTTGKRTLYAHWQRRTGHWVDVNLTTHMLKMMNGSKVMATFPISGGKPSTPSPTGTFRVYAQTADQSMGGYSHVKWCTWFKGNYAIHTAYWHNRFGIEAVSHGCVNMREADAKVIYNWMFIGAKVYIHGKWGGVPLA